MRCCCYILYSTKLDKFYIGESEDPVERLLLHNSAHFKSSFTSQADDWKIKLILWCNDRSHARRVESFIKRMKSRHFIQKLIKDSSLQESIIDKFR